jgi:hypothetical protein
MALKRKTSATLPVPADNTPIPAPKLAFNTQKPNASFPTGGLFSRGSIKFNLNNKPMVDLAKAAFTQYSSFKADANALDNFLLCLSITSNFEAGFDGVNTYDKAGVSVGFIQFARPEGGVGKLLTLIGRKDLADKAKAQFGIADPHSSPAANAARMDANLLKELVAASASPEGIKQQFAMAINQNVDGQLYFEKAYAKAKELKLTDPLCVAMLFDAAVNMGAGSVNKFKALAPGQTEGDWLLASTAIFTRPERKTGWVKIVNDNFA